MAILQTVVTVVTCDNCAAVLTHISGTNAPLLSEHLQLEGWHVTGAAMLYAAVDPQTRSTFCPLCKPHVTPTSPAILRAL